VEAFLPHRDREAERLPDRLVHGQWSLMAISKMDAAVHVTNATPVASSGLQIALIKALEELPDFQRLLAGNGTKPRCAV
jgi:hypothetical protein